MNLVLWFLHLPEGLCKYDIYCTAYVNQNIVDQKPLDDTRYNHSIIVRIIFELKVFLGEGDWDVRPLGFDERSMYPQHVVLSSMLPSFASC
jgi:predicted  nucleic acid-binding Zn ribbon protein